MRLVVRGKSSLEFAFEFAGLLARHGLPLLRWIRIFAEPQNSDILAKLLLGINRTLAKAEIGTVGPFGF